MTFTTDTTGKDLFTDALWSRREGSVSALEFPAFTCGMPSEFGRRSGHYALFSPGRGAWSP